MGPNGQSGTGPGMTGPAMGPNGQPGAGPGMTGPAMGPNGQGGPGMGPNGQGGPGAGGGNSQGPFSGGKSEGAEGVAQRFYDKLMAGEANDAADLFSSKASGKAKMFRDGKASESMIEEYKEAFSKVKLTSSKAVTGQHIVLFEENGSGAAAGGGAAGYGGGGYGGDGDGGGQAKRSLKKAGMKVQFVIVNEGGSLLIKDITIRAR